MRVKLVPSSQDDSVTLELDRDALRLLGNCINETFRTVDEPEFQTLLGNTVAEATGLQEQIVSIYRQKWPLTD